MVRRHTPVVPRQPFAGSRPSSSGAIAALLAVTSDPALADVVRRLAAAAAVDVLVTAEPDVQTWRASALVVVGADRARSVAASLPRRSGVVVVTSDRDDTPVWRLAVALGAEQVAVLPDAEAWLVDRLSACVDPPGRARVVGVVGGCGGAGASVLASALAVTAAESGRRVLLVDLDPLGGGLDLALGVDEVPGLRWSDLSAARGRMPSDSVHDSLPRLDDLAVLSWSRGEPVDVPPAAVDAVLHSAARGHDLVVVDLPRTGEDRLLAAALRDVHDLLLVVPARLRAAAAAAQLADRWRSSVPSAGVVVRRPPGARLTARTVADAVQLPLVLDMRDESQVDGALDRGEPPALRPSGPLRRAAERWLDGHLPAVPTAA